MSLYEIEVRRIDGRQHALSEFSGKALLVVNVASRCGFTPQYEALEALHRRYAPRGFAVLGFPCNQFGAQEPGDEEQIRNFCSATYQVTFPMFAKVEVNGSDAHPLYRQLVKAAPGLLGIRRIKWNFTKFLIDPRGCVVKRYAPSAVPGKLTKDIEAVLPG